MSFNWKSPDRMTLDDLYELALAWCPKRARWERLITSAHDWGSAHELGHALIEVPWRRRHANYKRCSLGFCTCRADSCDTHEIAAMMVSRRLLRATGNERLYEDEVKYTSDLDLVDVVHIKRARRLLRSKGLCPVPRTRKSLEAALKRRLGKPRGGKPRRRSLLEQTLQALGQYPRVS